MLIGIGAGLVADVLGRLLGIASGVCGYLVAFVWNRSWLDGWHWGCSCMCG